MMLHPEITGDCACFNLRSASRAISQVYDHALQPSGLRSTQFSLLAALAERGPMSLSRLAKRMAMDRTTLTRNVRPLERKRLIRVVPARDRRLRVVELTEEGRLALVDSVPLWKQAQARVLDRHGRERWDGLRDELQEVVEVARLLA
ncbi:MAG: MarR family winged helix-turn-helix transcriptional regulator [Alphaproteobacteria bacterium]